jgi:capsular exopolysaccharide synthesis family protein
LAEGSGGLPDLVDALRWRWKPAAVIALCIFAGAFFYIQKLPAEYDGKAIVAISPRANTAAGADTVRVGAPKYVAFAEAQETARTVSRIVDVPASTLDKGVNATVPVDTGNVSIVVRLKNPDRAANAANAFADQVVAFSKSDPLLTADIVARALPPSAPAAPPRRLLEAASLVVGVLIGVGVSLLLERGRPRLRSWRDMARMTGYPVVGRVPSSRVLRTRPTEAFADPITGSAFRTLRANIEPQLREQDIDVLLVTSPGKGDGKTTVAALLAESLGRLGMRVLLVDADLKRPRLARLAKLNGHPGLSDVLRERISLAQGIQQGWIDELSLLPTAAEPEAGDLLPRHFGDVVQQAREDYDVIVVDAPPLLGTDDARVIAPLAAGVILVVSAGSVASPVNEAVLTIESLKAPLLGIVGNRLKESRSLYYY